MSQTESSQGVCFRKEEREPSWETDLLGRKDAAHQLERLIANAPGPYVIAMTSEWGSGKTFFLKAWEKDLRDRHRPCVYFNAWETDHAGDPLLALTGCVTDSLKEQGFIEPSKLKELAESASKIVAQSPGTFAKLAVGVANHLSSGAVKEVKEILEDSVKLGTDLFLKNKQRRADFTNQLKKIAVDASTSAAKQDWKDPVNGTKKFPLFVMIDELDRCRPSYVIELLENTKHLFGVPGVVFLLAIDQAQILGVIQHTFGLCDTKQRDIRQNYLRKFIDTFWKLPEPDVYSFARYNLRNKKIDLPKDWKPICSSDIPATNNIKNISIMANAQDAFIGMLAQIAANSSSSLRETLQAIDKYYIIYTAYNTTWKESIAIFSLLLTTDNTENGIREKLRNQGIETIGLHTIDQYSKSISSVSICLVLVSCFGITMNEKSENGSNLYLLNFLTSLGVCNPQNRPDYASLYDKIQFLDSFHFGDDATQTISAQEQ